MPVRLFDVDRLFWPLAWDLVRGPLFWGGKEVLTVVEQPVVEVRPLVVPVFASAEVWSWVDVWLITWTEGWSSSWLIVKWTEDWSSSCISLSTYELIWLSKSWSICSGISPTSSASSERFRLSRPGLEQSWQSAELHEKKQAMSPMVTVAVLRFRSKMRLITCSLSLHSNINHPEIAFFMLMANLHRKRW